MYKEDLTLNTLKWFIYQRTKPNETIVSVRVMGNNGGNPCMYHGTRLHGTSNS